MTIAADLPSGSWLDQYADRSDLGALVAAHDWSSTPLGDPDTWPLSLRIVVGVCLTSRFPMLVVWGPELTKIYNDGYRLLLGSEKHPRALGAPAREIWPEIWDTIGPMFDEVMAGDSTFDEHQLLEMHRNGFLEECYFTYSYSPIAGDDGTPGGVLDVVSETTEQVVNARRLQCLGTLVGNLVSATQITHVCTQAVAALTECGDDVHSVEVHLSAGDRLVRVATNRRGAADGVSEETLERVLADGALVILDDTWVPDQPVRRVAVPTGGADVGGVLVAELNPKRPFDQGYRDFVELVAGNIGAALENAYRRSVELGEQRVINDALQSAMLQPASDLPTVAARYLPATGSLSVGGDWYDVISLEDGRRALVVGDCVGHGLAAATVMGQLRSASRALLLEGRSPAEVLEAMDRFASSVDGAICTTMICSVLDLDERTITYAIAGHPPPLVVGESGSRWLHDGRCAPLAVSGANRGQATASLAPDDVLVLYTDGLVERRDDDIDAGLTRLREAAERRRHQTVEELADGLLAELLDPTGRDDVALVVKRFAEPAG